MKENQNRIQDITNKSNCIQMNNVTTMKGME